MRDEAMNEITLIIDGKQAKGQQGDTILQVCEKNDIYVPSLCHYSGLRDIGTCRMCVVELQGGVRIVTACTTPAEDGMVVGTQSPRLEKLRRSTLELLFSERNHYCMFCEASGDCELQQLAYRHGMDRVRYPALYP
ncbi:MAG: 2Fe-2S iron-sulfur cluster-binding protein, partial [Armatimonadota bacterium]|nr:2Fe-2S iron-sulfur cluster-binding protein [Armatimonadota bacterium]